LGNKQIRCNWATKNSGEEKQSSDNQNAVILTNGSSSSIGEEESAARIIYSSLTLCGRISSPWEQDSVDTCNAELKHHISLLVWACLVMYQLLILIFLLTTDGSQENSNDEAPENNPAYTTVYVGNLAHEVIPPPTAPPRHDVS